MEVSINISTVINGIVVLFLAWGCKLIYGVDKKITELGQWAKQHDKQDDERHLDLTKRIGRVEQVKMQGGDGIQ